MKRQKGFTLVELLVVIAIIGVLVSLLLPAVNAAREAARRTQCKNNLRNLALAFVVHENTHSFFPSSGWGWRWQGEADRGFGESQPGGWAYNVLPFMEEQALRDLGSESLPPEQRARERLAMVGTPIPIFNCPSRRSAIAYPLVRNSYLAYNLRECVENECLCARSDYQVNMGNTGPLTAEEAGPNSYEDVDGFNWQFQNRYRMTGVSYQRSEIKIRQITDGLTKTVCIGEKYLNPDSYSNGEDLADDQNLFTGQDRDMNGLFGRGSDLVGSTNTPVRQPYPPKQDQRGLARNFDFGSAHPGGLHMAMCDASISTVSYAIDPQVYLRMGGRNDDKTPYTYVEP